MYYFPFYCCDKTLTKASLGGNVLFGIQVPGYSALLREVGAGIQAEQEPEGRN